MSTVRIFVLLVLVLASFRLAAQTDTTFTYQGELTDSGAPAEGAYRMEFFLWDAPSGGNSAGASILLNDVEVNDGIFTVDLDFGAHAFTNDGRWLEIRVNDVALEPRQALTRTPYAIQTRGIFVDSSSNVGIGTTQPADELHVQGTAPAMRLDDGSNILSHTKIEDSSGSQMRMYKTNSAGNVLMDFNPNPTDGSSDAVIRIFRETDTTGLKSVNFQRGNNSTQISASIGVDGKDSFFQINGGDVGIGILDPAAKLHVVGGTDAAPNGGGYIQAGETLGPNVVIDDNEIMARNGLLPSNLHINNDGGNIIFGGAIDIGLERVDLVGGNEVLTAVCPVGKKVLAGGCDSFFDEIQASYPEGEDRWTCDFTSGSEGNRAYAVCAYVVGFD